MPDIQYNKSIDKPSLPAIRAYLGGSFNPVHNGHIQMAMQVYNSLVPLAKQQRRELQVSLLPNARSPFKQKTIAPEHRLAMLKLAIQNTPLQINELELWQTPPVYTIDSVRTLRQSYPNDSLIFIMGMDSARSLDKWKDGLQLINYVSLWVFNRLDNEQNLFAPQSLYTQKNFPAPQNTTKKDKSFLPIELQGQVTDSPIDLISSFDSIFKPALLCQKGQLHQKHQPLKSRPQGCIYLDPRPIETISSTDIRKQFCESAQKHECTGSKPNYLAKHLNPAVYQYIITHQLYSAAQFR